MLPQAPYVHTLGNEGRGGATDSINLQNVYHNMLCKVEHKNNGRGFGKVVYYSPLDDKEVDYLGQYKDHKYPTRYPS